MWQLIALSKRDSLIYIHYITSCACTILSSKRKCLDKRNLIESRKTTKKITKTMWCQVRAAKMLSVEKYFVCNVVYVLTYSIVGIIWRINIPEYSLQYSKSVWFHRYDAMREKAFHPSKIIHFADQWKEINSNKGNDKSGTQSECKITRDSPRSCVHKKMRATDQ